jgi:myosin-5
MQDVKHLDADVLDDLICSLKIPAPSLMNPSAVKAGLSLHSREALLHQ